MAKYIVISTDDHSEKAVVISEEFSSITVAAAHAMKVEGVVVQVVEFEIKRKET